MDAASVVVGFLGDDPHELAPPRIGDRACEPAISDHAYDVQVLDVDHLALANQRQSLLVVIVPSGTGHFAVFDGDLAPRLFLLFDPNRLVGVGFWSLVTGVCS